MISKLCRVISVCVIAAAILLTGMTVTAAESLSGDVDVDGDVNVVDVTYIQRDLAGIPVSGSFFEPAADVDGSGGVEIMDATFIQLWLANALLPYPIGEPFELPTEPPTEPPTQRATDAEGWGTDIFRP